MKSLWSGSPVEFYDNVSYACGGEDLYFENDRDQAGPYSFHLHEFNTMYIG